MRSHILVSLSLIVLAAVANGAITKKVIQNTVNAFSKVNSAENIGKMVRLGCAASPLFRSLMQSLKDASAQGLNCCYNNGLTAIKSYKGNKKIDYNAMLTKIQSSVTQKCSSSIGGFAPAAPILLQVLTSSPSSLFIGYSTLPASAKKIADQVSALSTKVADNPDYLKNKNFPSDIKAITKAIRDMPQADCKTLANSFPGLGAFIVKGGANVKQLNNYLNFIDQDVSGNLNSKQLPNFKKLAVKMLNLVINLFIKRFQTFLSGLDKAVVPDAIKSDAAANSAIKVIAPFFVQTSKTYINNGKFVPALVTLSKQADTFAKKCPNLITAIVKASDGSLDTSMFTIPWAILP